MAEFPEYPDKRSLRDRIRLVDLEEPARQFRDRVRELLRLDGYRKSASRELSWYLLEAALDLASAPTDQAEAERQKKEAEALLHHQRMMAELDQVIAEHRQTHSG